MLAILSLLIIIMLSVIVVRIGATALELTGLSSEIASFQAQSAFSGVGFTTAESETIVNHPVRRRIVRMLILLGSAGLTTSMATLVLAFLGQSAKSALLRAETLALGLLLILIVTRSRHLYNITKKIITKALERWTVLRFYDYEQMFGLSEGYSISKITVKEESWLSNKQLKDLRPELKEILILAIYRHTKDTKEFIGAPHGDTMIKPGDALICYARQEEINRIFAKGEE